MEKGESICIYIHKYSTRIERERERGKKGIRERSEGRE